MPPAQRSYGPVNFLTTGSAETALWATGPVISWNMSSAACLMSHTVPVWRLSGAAGPVMCSMQTLRVLHSWPSTSGTFQPAMTYVPVPYRASKQWKPSSPRSACRSACHSWASPSRTHRSTNWRRNAPSSGSGPSVAFARWIWKISAGSITPQINAKKMQGGCFT